MAWNLLCWLGLASASWMLGLKECTTISDCWEKRVYRHFWLAFTLLRLSFWCIDKLLYYLFSLEMEFSVIPALNSTNKEYGEKKMSLFDYLSSDKSLPLEQLQSFPQLLENIHCLEVCEWSRCWFGFSVRSGEPLLFSTWDWTQPHTCWGTTPHWALSQAPYPLFWLYASYILFYFLLKCMYISYPKW